MHWSDQRRLQVNMEGQWGLYRLKIYEWKEKGLPCIKRLGKAHQNQLWNSEKMKIPKLYPRVLHQNLQRSGALF